MNDIFVVHAQTLLQLLFSLLAFWLAGRIILCNLALLNTWGKAGQLLIWLALAGGFTRPFIDLSRILTALLEAFSTPVADSLAAWAYYQAISSAVTVLVYGMVVAITWPLIANTGWFASTGLRLDNFERLMLVFGLAGLVNLFISMILSLFWSGVLQGDALPGLNFIKEWGAGLLLLLVLIGLIYWRLGRSQV
jgi:hypothetical protein